MNGIDAAAIATGQDFRALEAGAHAWASRTGTYRPLTHYRLVDVCSFVLLSLIVVRMVMKCPLKDPLNFQSQLESVVVLFNLTQQCNSLMGS